MIMVMTQYAKTAVFREGKLYHVESKYLKYDDKGPCDIFISVQLKHTATPEL